MSLRVFKSAWFARFARKHNISDAILCEAVARAARGQIDAALGQNVIKQRLERPGEGRAKGYRTIVFFEKEKGAFFVYAFAKKHRDNIKPNEKRAYVEAAPYVLNTSREQLYMLVSKGHYIEVDCDEDSIS